MTRTYNLREGRRLERKQNKSEGITNTRRGEIIKPVRTKTKMLRKRLRKNGGFEKVLERELSEKHLLPRRKVSHLHRKKSRKGKKKLTQFKLKGSVKKIPLKKICVK